MMDAKSGLTHTTEHPMAEGSASRRSYERILSILSTLTVGLLAFSLSIKAGASNLKVNDPSTDVVGSIQSETSVAIGNGVACIAWNDMGELPVRAGFGSVDLAGSVTADRRAFPIGPDGTRSDGDPSVTFSPASGTFYFASNATDDVTNAPAIALWRSNDCQTLEYLGVAAFTGGFPDRPTLTIGDNPSGGSRLFVGFSRGAGGNFVSYIDEADVTTGLNENDWTPFNLPASADSGWGIWPVAAPNPVGGLTGEMYVAFGTRDIVIGEANGMQELSIYKSTDFGDEFVQVPEVADIGTMLAIADDDDATVGCSEPSVHRQALKGPVDLGDPENPDDDRTLGIKVRTSPQIAITRDPIAGDPGYIIHAVYEYDSDGAGPDNSDVFYKRWVGAAGWSEERKLNEDSSDSDQWFPALAATDDGIVAVAWYDRREDPNNLKFQRYLAVSKDWGETWFTANRLVSDPGMGSPVALPTPDDEVEPCYHGDYDHLAIDAGKIHVVWSDDRDGDPDVFYQAVSVDDFDGDDVPDVNDNCDVVANAAPANCDTNQDGFGNRCDCDFDGDMDCDVDDFNRFRTGFQTQNDPNTDSDCDGDTDVTDFNNFRTNFQNPGNLSSGLSCAGMSTPCL